MKDPKILARDVIVTTIPFGEAITLRAGSSVTITQSLGGSFTGMTDNGYMVRVEGRDADAIGEPPPQAASPNTAGDKPLRDLIWDQLKTCYDPEIPVNIVDLGLVYACDVSDLPGGGHRVSIDFTLTSPACPLSPMLEEDIRNKVSSVPDVREVEARVVFEPLWNASMMSDAARLELGMM